MNGLYLPYLLYFILTGLSIIGIIITGYLVKKQQRKKESYLIHKPKILYILAIWGSFYIISFSIEWLGHIIGLWTWLNTNYIFLHAAVWWANVLTILVIYLSTLKPIIRYLIILSWVLLFEYLQETLIHWVTHFPLFGNPYTMITLVMCLTCSVNFIIFNLFVKLKFLKKIK